MKLYNLEQHNSQTNRHERTIAHNIPYAMAKGIKNRLEVSPKMPGTYWKITETKKQTACAGSQYSSPSH